MLRAGFRPAEIRLEADGTLVAGAAGPEFRPAGGPSPWRIVSAPDDLPGREGPGRARVRALNPPGDPPRVRLERFEPRPDGP